MAGYWVADPSLTVWCAVHIPAQVYGYGKSEEFLGEFAKESPELGSVSRVARATRMS